MSRCTHFPVILLVWIAAILAAFGSAAADPTGKAAAAPTRPVAALMPLRADGQLQLSDTDRCPLCGMFPARRPKSATAITLDDGRTFYFCGNGCLLRAWHDPATCLQVTTGSIQRMVTRDYFSGMPLDALKAWWVAGSDVVGPMGPALVALSNEADVVPFKARHGGTSVFQLSQMDDALWQKCFPPKK